jgi:hypothetical protein
MRCAPVMNSVIPGGFFANPPDCQLMRFHQLTQMWQLPLRAPKKQTDIRPVCDRDHGR